MPMPPTGEQFEIRSGAAQAVVTEVGAGLRAFSVDGRPFVETFDADSRPPRGAGCVLVPWPNRTARGQWLWDGGPQQLALSEPAAGNAIHGLLRHTLYRADEQSPDAVTLSAVVAPQPGWPVPLATSVRYAVDAGGLTVTHTVSNVGTAAVPFGVGAHPYLRAGAADTDDCTLHLAATTALPLGGGLPVAPAAPVPRPEITLRGAELDHAFGGCVPVGDDDLVRHRLSGPDGEVELWADPDFGWVQVFTPDDHPGRGRAVAVEPMTCPPDALNSGTGLLVVGPGETWSGRWGISPR
ncbi:aldose 1-epimerase family protein [Pseudonocardia abyssalis]|jgi:aldose 1-epimerase|uniref:Aldose 1-epimerase family protein n=1 Tax=Pseudonocardia abyssalis TaxID=2792008 RepID=A0ABS6UZP4_9PSEU|nr:aldose 1-epimerase family protein [Pseudonocardia abyssalis]MBW0118266.1 aldose 1-epimerase family protein [Pseudonocardia abyssalis]MBW0137338.1 aldose 1-epimerase family protein [Pseudonocardia abyssalis]